MEMLVYSRAGVIGLLPASPESLSKGSIKGILCRTQAKIDDLTWDLETRKIDVTISSRVDQTIQLFVAKGIESVNAPEGVLTAPVPAGSEECSVRLSASHPITLHFTMGIKDRAGWMNKGNQ
jgi:hypothetical protein